MNTSNSHLLAVVFLERAALIARRFSPEEIAILAALWMTNR